MPFLAFLLPVWRIVASFFSALVSTEFGRLILAVVVALAIGDFHGSHSAKVAAEKARLEATIAARERDLRVANEVAELARSQAADADKANADAIRAIEEIRAHAKDRNCLLSPADVDRLRRAGRVN